MIPQLLEWLLSKGQEISIICWDIKKQKPWKLMEISISSATMENSYGNLLKLKELLYDQEIQVLGIYPKEIKTGY